MTKKIDLMHLARMGAVFCTVLCAGCGGGSDTASGAPTPSVTTTITTTTTTTTTAATATIKGTIAHDLSVDSKKIGVVYPTQIYVPADYAGTNDLLPIIYALDGEGIADTGEARFPMMVRLLEANGVRAILVGIGNYSRRATDYLLPGASTYYEFLTQELIPAVEARYRADPAKRTLDGHSFGGFFVAAALTKDRPDLRFFANFIVQDPSIWVAPDSVAAMEQAMFDASKGSLPNTTLIVSTSVLGSEASAQPWYQRIEERNYAGLSLTRLPPYSVSHDAMFAPSFIASVLLLK